MQHSLRTATVSESDHVPFCRKSAQTAGHSEKQVSSRLYFGTQTAEALAIGAHTSTAMVLSRCAESCDTKATRSSKGRLTQHLRPKQLPTAALSRSLSILPLLNEEEYQEALKRPRTVCGCVCLHLHANDTGDH